MELWERILRPVKMPSAICSQHLQRLWWTGWSSSYFGVCRRPQMEALHFRQISTRYPQRNLQAVLFFSHANLVCNAARKPLLTKNYSAQLLLWLGVAVIFTNEHRPTPYLISFTNHQQMPHNNIQCVLAVTLRWLRTHQPTRPRGVRWIRHSAVCGG